MTFDTNRKPRVGVITQRPHQTRGGHLSIDFVVIGSELDLDGLFVHVSGGSLYLAVGALDARDLAGELGRFTAHLGARSGEVADYFVVVMELKLLLFLFGALHDVGFGYSLRPVQGSRVHGFQAVFG